MSIDFGAQTGDNATDSTTVMAGMLVFCVCLLPGCQSASAEYPTTSPDLRMADMLQQLPG